MIVEKYGCLTKTNIEINRCRYWYYKVNFMEIDGKLNLRVIYYTHKPSCSDANHNLQLYFDISDATKVPSDDKGLT